MSFSLSRTDISLKPGSSSRPIYRGLVVDRDLMGSHLLADALIRGLAYEASAVSASSLLTSVANSKVNWVVIAAELEPGMKDGLKLAAAINREFPSVAIVVLLDQNSRTSVLNAFRSGARGVFSRQQPLSEFLDCVEHVTSGLIWAGKEATGLLLAALQSVPATSISPETDSTPLTNRELQVVHHAAEGKTNKGIARELGLSEHTVKNYLFRAFEKLGVSSRIELLFYLTTRGYSFGIVGRADCTSSAPMSSYTGDCTTEQEGETA